MCWTISHEKTPRKTYDIHTDHYRKLCTPQQTDQTALLVRRCFQFSNSPLPLSDFFFQSFFWICFPSINWGTKVQTAFNAGHGQEKKSLCSKYSIFYNTTLDQWPKDYCWAQKGRLLTAGHPSSRQSLWVKFPLQLHRVNLSASHRIGHLDSFLGSPLFCKKRPWKIKRNEQMSNFLSSLRCARVGFDSMIGFIDAYTRRTCVCACERHDKGRTWWTRATSDLIFIRTRPASSWVYSSLRTNRYLFSEDAYSPRLMSTSKHAHLSWKDQLLFESIQYSSCLASLFAIRYFSVFFSCPCDIPANRPPDTPAMGAKHIGTESPKALVNGVCSTISYFLSLCLFFSFFTVLKLWSTVVTVPHCVHRPRFAGSVFLFRHNFVHIMKWLVLWGVRGGVNLVPRITVI